MSDRFPLMLYRDGEMLPEHGVDYLIVGCETEMVNALTDGWREELEAPRHPLDHDGDGVPGGSLPDAVAPRRRGRKPKGADNA
jgi:hypothetical protein